MIAHTGQHTTVEMLLMFSWRDASHLFARTTPWLSLWALFHKQTGFCRLARSVYILLRIRAEQREEHSSQADMTDGEKLQAGESAQWIWNIRQCSLERKRANRDMVNYWANHWPQCCVCIYIRHFPRCLTWKYLGFMVKTFFLFFYSWHRYRYLKSKVADNKVCTLRQGRSLLKGSPFFRKGVHISILNIHIT